MLMPEKERRKLTSDWKGSIGSIVQLDLFKDLLPNIGPDWGVCVLPAKNASQVPKAIMALAVKPGSKKPPVDQTLFHGLDFLAKIAVLKHNETNPSTPIRLESLSQDKTEVKYLVGEKVFPPGIAPAFALKDGFLLVASTPEAIERFTLRENKPNERRETPLVRISAPELARLLEHRREHILRSLPPSGRQTTSRKCDRPCWACLINSRSAIAAKRGKRSWTLRLSPAATRN